MAYIINPQNLSYSEIRTVAGLEGLDGFSLRKIGKSINRAVRKAGKTVEQKLRPVALPAAAIAATVFIPGAGAALLKAGSTVGKFALGTGGKILSTAEKVLTPGAAPAAAADPAGQPVQPVQAPTIQPLYSGESGAVSYSVYPGGMPAEAPAPAAQSNQLAKLLPMALGILALKSL